MKLNKIFSLLLVFFMSVVLAQPVQAKDKGQDAYNAGNYELALKIWSKEIVKYERRNKVEQCPYYTKAGIAAFKLGKMDLAQKYLEAARYSVSKNETTYNLLAQIYHKIDNLSKEIDALEYYVKNYPNGKNIINNRDRLFLTYVESENWDQGLKLWPNILSDVKTNPEYQTGLLKIYIGLNMDKEAFPLAEDLVKKDRKNIPALQFLGQYYFWLAENSYQAENKAYAANRTNAQYAHLLKVYKVITVNFKKSLDYFQPLYNLKPSAKVAVYLGDVYARLSDKKNADYYHQMAKKLK
ncbi:MAG: tetratricopeptide repeat protein [Bacteroidales bacterium]|nr:tetratricopeptide repeat protein [Bacteroidales bacterium]